MWLRWWVLMRLYYYHHLPVNIWYLDAERGSHYWTDADLLFCSHPVSAGQMGWRGGGRRDAMGSLGGTADPLPLPISCTNNMPHASWARPILYSDRSSPALKPPRTTGRIPLPAVSKQPAQLARWGLNKFPSSQWERLLFIRAVTFYKQRHN